MPATHVMVVDDELLQRRLLRTALVARGFEVSEAASGEQALAAIGAEPPEVMLLDLNLPGMGGLEVCRAIREHSQVPIIIVSVRQSARDKVAALDSGADDYVVKPFDIEELSARIRAVKRRSGMVSPRVLALGAVQINLHTRTVRRGDATIHLTSKEFKLLDCLISHAGQVLTHRRLLQAVWGPDYGDEIEYLRVCIHQLRKKIEPKPEEPQYIVTEPLTGYRFSAVIPGGGPPVEPTDETSNEPNPKPPGMDPPRVRRTSEGKGQ